MHLVVFPTESRLMIFQHCYFVLEVGGGRGGPGERGDKDRQNRREKDIAMWFCLVFEEPLFLS